MPIIKNLSIEDYNLLNIKNTKERPYFFGLGIPTRFNCNYGFKSKIKNRAQSESANDEYPERNGKSLNDTIPFKLHKKD